MVRPARAPCLRPVASLLATTRPNAALPRTFVTGFTRRRGKRLPAAFAGLAPRQTVAALQAAVGRAQRPGASHVRSAAARARRSPSEFLGQRGAAGAWEALEAQSPGPAGWSSKTGMSRGGSLAEANPPMSLEQLARDPHIGTPTAHSPEPAWPLQPLAWGGEPRESDRPWRVADDLSAVRTELTALSRRVADGFGASTGATGGGAPQLPLYRGVRPMGAGGWPLHSPPLAVRPLRSRSKGAGLDPATPVGQRPRAGDGASAAGPPGGVAAGDSALPDGGSAAKGGSAGDSGSAASRRALNDTVSGASPATDSSSAAGAEADGASEDEEDEALERELARAERRAQELAAEASVAERFREAELAKQRAEEEVRMLRRASAEPAAPRAGGLTGGAGGQEDWAGWGDEVGGPIALAVGSGRDARAPRTPSPREGVVSRGRRRSISRDSSARRARGRASSPAASEAGSVGPAAAAARRRAEAEARRWRLEAAALRGELLGAPAAGAGHGPGAWGRGDPGHGGFMAAVSALPGGASGCQSGPSVSRGASVERRDCDSDGRADGDWRRRRSGAGRRSRDRPDVVVTGGRATYRRGEAFGGDSDTFERPSHSRFRHGAGTDAAGSDSSGGGRRQPSAGRLLVPLERSGRGQASGRLALPGPAAAAAAGSAGSAAPWSGPRLAQSRVATRSLSSAHRRSRRLSFSQAAAAAAASSAARAATSAAVAAVSPPNGTASLRPQRGPSGRGHSSPPRTGHRASQSPHPELQLRRQHRSRSPRHDSGTGVSPGRHGDIRSSAGSGRSRESTSFGERQALPARPIQRITSLSYDRETAQRAGDGVAASGLRNRRLDRRSLERRHPRVRGLPAPAAATDPAPPQRGTQLLGSAAPQPTPWQSWFCPPGAAAPSQAALAPGPAAFDPPAEDVTADVTQRASDEHLSHRQSRLSDAVAELRLSAPGSSREAEALRFLATALPAHGAAMAEGWGGASARGESEFGEADMQSLMQSHRGQQSSWEGASWGVGGSPPRRKPAPGRGSGWGGEAGRGSAGAAAGMAGAAAAAGVAAAARAAQARGPSEGLLRRRLSSDRPTTASDGSPGPNVSPTHQQSLDRPTSRVLRGPRTPAEIDAVATASTATAVPLRGTSPPAHRGRLAPPSADRGGSGRHQSRGPPLAASSLAVSPPPASRHALRASAAPSVSPSAPPLPPPLAAGMSAPAPLTGSSVRAMGGQRSLARSARPSTVPSADVQALVDSQVARAMRGGGAAEDAVAAILADGVPLQQRHLDKWGLRLASPGQGRSGARVVRAVSPQRESNGAGAGRAGIRGPLSRDAHAAGFNGQPGADDSGRAKPRRHAPSSAHGAIAPGGSARTQAAPAVSGPAAGEAAAQGVSAGEAAAGGAPSHGLNPLEQAHNGSADTDDVDRVGFADASGDDGSDEDLFSPSPPPLPATPVVRRVGVAPLVEGSTPEAAPEGRSAAHPAASAGKWDVPRPVSDATPRPPAEPSTPSGTASRRVVVRSVGSPSPAASARRSSLRTRPAVGNVPAPAGFAPGTRAPAPSSHAAATPLAAASAPGPRRVSVSASPSRPEQRPAPRRFTQPHQPGADRPQRSPARRQHDGFDAVAGSARAAAGAALTASRLEQTLLGGGSALLGQRSAVKVRRSPASGRVGAGGPGGAAGPGSKPAGFGAPSLA